MKLERRRALNKESHKRRYAKLKAQREVAELGKRAELSRKRYLESRRRSNRRYYENGSGGKCMISTSAATSSCGNASAELSSSLNTTSSNVEYSSETSMYEPSYDDYSYDDTGPDHEVGEHDSGESCHEEDRSLPQFSDSDPDNEDQLLDPICSCGGLTVRTLTKKTRMPYRDHVQAHQLIRSYLRPSMMARHVATFSGQMSCTRCGNASALINCRDCLCSSLCPDCDLVMHEPISFLHNRMGLCSKNSITTWHPLQPDEILSSTGDLLTVPRYAPVPSCPLCFNRMVPSSFLLLWIPLSLLLLAVFLLSQ